MQKFKFKKLLSIILFTCLFLFTIRSTIAFAYVLEGFGHNTSSFGVNTSGMTTFLSYWNPSINAWNNASYKVNIYTDNINTVADNTIWEMTVYDSWYGATAQYNYLPSGRTRSFQITINRYLCTSSIVQSTIVHELGHVLNLHENNNVVAPYNSIMNTYRDRTTLKTPTSDDVAGVNASY